MLPFLQPVHGYPITSFYSEWLAFALGIAALAPLAGKRVWQDMTLPVIALAPLALIAVLMIQLVTDRVPYAGQAMLAAIYLVWAALLILLGAQLRRELGMQTVTLVLAVGVLAGGELSALVGVLQYYEISSFLDPLVAKSPGRSYGNLAQPNHYAAYMALALASVAYLFASGRMRAAVAAASATPLVFALGLSLSRSAWLYLVAAFALALLLYVRHRGEQNRRLAFCAGFVLAGFAVDQWLMSLQLFAPAASEVDTATRRILADPGFGIKVEHARTAWWAFMQAPLLGVGWGQFAWYDFDFKATFGVRYEPELLFAHSHNLVTQLLAETGLAGTLLITGGALLWLRDLRKARFDLEHWWLLALLATLGVHSLLEYPLWYAYFLGLAAIAIGMGATRLVTLELQRIGRLAALLVIVGGTVNALSLFYGYRDFERMFKKEAYALSEPQLGALLSRAHADPLLEHYAELAATYGIIVDRGNLREKLELNSRVMRFAPIESVVYRQALLQALNGEADAAQRQFSRAMRVYPSELPRVTAGLHDLAVKYPEEFTPLLELAVASAAEARNPPAAR